MRFISCTTILLATLLLIGCQPSSSVPTKQTLHSQQGAFAATISDSGQYAVVSSLYHGVSLWDINTQGVKYNWYQSAKDDNFNLFEDEGKQVAADNNFVFAVDIAKDDSHAVLADQHNFSLWDIATGQNVGYWQIKQSLVSYPNPSKKNVYDIIDKNKCIEPDVSINQGCEITSDIRAIAVSNKGKHILLGKSDGIAVAIELATGRRMEFLGHQQKVIDDDGDSFHINNSINSVAISPNGLYALTGSSDKTAYLWNTKTGQVVYKFQHGSRVTLVTFDAKGQYAFTSDSKKQANIWDLTTGKKVSNLKFINRQEVFTTASFSANGKYIVTGAPTRKLSLWEIKTGKQINEWTVTAKSGSRPASAVVYSAKFINNDTQIATESSSGLYEVWDIKK